MIVTTRTCAPGTGLPCRRENSEQHYIRDHCGNHKERDLWLLQERRMKERQEAERKALGYETGI